MPVNVLKSAADITPEIESHIEEALEWFDGRQLNTEEFIDRVADSGLYADPPYDIENYDNSAARKIMRVARKMRREQTT